MPVLSLLQLVIGATLAIVVLVFGASKGKPFRGMLSALAMGVVALTAAMLAAHPLGAIGGPVVMLLMAALSMSATGKQPKTKRRRRRRN